jgi:hypothetical protein
MAAHQSDPESLTPAAARGALYRLAKHPNPSADEHTAEDRGLLAAAAKALDRCVNKWGRVGTCPTCQSFGIPVLWAEEHVVGCSRHPAVLRSQRAEAEWIAVKLIAEKLGARVPPLHDLPPRPNWPKPTSLVIAKPTVGEPLVGERMAGYLLDFDVHHSLVHLCEEPHVAGSAKTAEKVALLEVMLSEWQFFLDRAAKPRQCPSCGAEFDGKALPQHVAECPAHPEAKRAEIFEAAASRLTGGVNVGVGPLVDDRERLRRAFSDFVRAAGEFHGSLGWDNDRYYVRKSDEAEFVPALERARAELAK